LFFNPNLLMNNETIQVTYEAIGNPILRLLIIFMAVAVTSLIGAIVYLYRERQQLQREMIDMNREALIVYDRISDALEELRRSVDNFSKK
jgi:cell division protein FtsL